VGILDVDSLSITIPSSRGDLRVVDQVSLAVESGEVVAIVGETGSGKTLTAMTALGLYPTRARLAGTVRVQDIEVIPPSGASDRLVRGRIVAVVLQNPSTSLNPVFTIGQQIGELLRTHQRLRKPGDIRRVAVDYFREVELPRPDAVFDAYPYELSGGMQQRVLIALALACRPKLIVADEPTTALDVTTQAQILAMLKRLRAEHGMAMLWITHDLSVASQVADRIAVLYAGAIVEMGPAGRVLREPEHPYTRSLLASLPTRGKSVRDLAGLPGDIPSPAAIPPGCRFHPRCPRRFAPCDTIEPAQRWLDPERMVACHLFDPPAEYTGTETP